MGTVVKFMTNLVKGSSTKMTRGDYEKAKFAKEWDKARSNAFSDAEMTDINAMFYRQSLIDEGLPADQ